MAIKRIAVNNGMICISVPEQLQELHSFAQSVQQQMGKAAKKAGRRRKDIDVSKYCKSIAEGFDSLFGDGACEKTFGTEMPNFDMIVEFFEKLSPLIERWVEEQEGLNE